MSNVNASEENTESPSTYANDAYKEFRKKEKEKPKDEILNKFFETHVYIQTQKITNIQHL